MIERMIEESQLGSSKNLQAKMLINAVDFSAKSMWYYNLNQIQRMKIRKNEFQIQATCTI